MGGVIAEGAAIEIDNCAAGICVWKDNAAIREVADGPAIEATVGPSTERSEAEAELAGQRERNTAFGEIILGGATR